jgi:uncharacterized membrane protein YeaQ/YmgE (transglycosylase-associated protein family)
LSSPPHQRLRAPLYSPSADVVHDPLHVPLAQVVTTAIQVACGGSLFCLKLMRRNRHMQDRTAPMWHILWTIIIGFIAGIIAKFLHPGPNEPQGFILTTILGIVGAFVATYLGQAIGWYKAGEGAGLIGAIVGAVILLVIWGFVFAPKKSA